jgi:hypothetical protein
MRNPGGYCIITEPGKPDVEHDTFTCGHCNRIVHVLPKQDPASLGGFCRTCWKLTCARCADGLCTPFEKKLEAMEQRDRFLRAVLEA